LRAFGAWRAFCLQAGATGAGLRTFIRARAAPACLAPGLRLPACLAVGAGAEPSPAAGGPGGRAGGRAGGPAGRNRGRAVGAGRGGAGRLPADPVADPPTGMP